MNKNLERGECSTLKVNENDNSVVLDNFEEQAKVSIINNKESGKAYQKAFEGEKGLKPDVEEPPNFEESPDFEEPQDFKESPHIPLNSQINENIMQAEGREPSDSEKFTNIMRKTGVRLFNMDPFNSYCKLLYTIEEELSSEEPPDFPPPPPINKNTMQTEKQLLVNGPNNLDTSSNQIPYQTEGDNHSKVKPNHQKRLADQRHVSTNRRSKRFCEQPSDSEKPSEDESLDNSSNHPMNKNMMQAERRSLSNPIQAPYQNNKQISNQISTNNNSNVILKHQKRVVVNQQVVPINLISGTDCEQPNEFEETADCESLTDFEEVYSSPNPTVNKNMLHTKRRSLSNQIQAKKQKKYAQITNQIHTTNNSNVKNNHQQSVVENDQGVPINLLSLPDFEEPSDCEQPSYCEEPSYCEQPLDCGQPSDCKQLTDFKEPTHSSPNAAVNKNMMQAERRALRNPKQATIQKNTKIPNQMYANNNSNVKNNHQQRVVVNEQGVPLSLISRPGFEEPTDSSNRTFNKNLMHAERGLINNEPKNLAPVCNQIPATYPNSPNSSQTYIDPHSEVTPNNPKSFKNLPRVPIDLEEAFKALLPNYLPPNIQTQKVAHSEVDTIPKKTLADLHGAPSNIRPKPDFEEPANCEEPFDYEGQAYFGEPSDCEEPTDFDPNQSSFPPNHFSPNHTMMHAEIGMVPNGSNNLPPFVNKIKAAYPNIPNPSETYIDPHSEVTPKNQKSVENIQRIPIGLEEALETLLPNYLSSGISTQKVAYSEVDATPKITLANVPSNVRAKPDFKEPAHYEEPCDNKRQSYFEEPSDFEEPTDFPPNQSSFPPNPNHSMMQAERGMVPNGSNNLPPFVNKIQAAYPNIPNPNPHSEVTPKNQRSLENIQQVPIGLEEALKALLPNYLSPGIPTQKVAYSEVVANPKKTLADVHSTPSNVRPKPDFKEPAHCEEPSNYKEQFYFEEPADCKEPTNFPPNQSSFPPNHTTMHAEMGILHNGPNNLPPFVNKIQAAYPNIPNPSETYRDPHSEVTPKSQKSLENIPIGLEEAFKALLPNYLYPDVQTQKVTHSEVEPSTKNTLVYGAISHVKPKPNLDEPINPSRNRTINRNMFKSERGLSSNGPPNFTTCFNHNHIVPSKRPIPTQTSTEAYPEELNHRKTLEGVQCIPREVAAAFQLISPNYVPPNLQKKNFPSLKRKSNCFLNPCELSARTMTTNVEFESATGFNFIPKLKSRKFSTKNVKQYVRREPKSEQPFLNELSLQRAPTYPVFAGKSSSRICSYCNKRYTLSIKNDSRFSNNFLFATLIGVICGFLILSLVKYMIHDSDILDKLFPKQNPEWFIVSYIKNLIQRFLNSFT